ncbi:MAG: VPLPA-CTERM sorting domain-containing protein [Cyanobacteria bacterium P01_E01_bin.6]
MNQFNKHTSSLAIASTVLLSLALPGHALDNEPNDRYGDRDVLESGITVVQGDLARRFDPDAFDYAFSSTMIPGSAESFDLEDLTPEQPFFAWIDNGDLGPDTVMGLLSEENLLLNWDDDSSPVGNGVASALSGVVNPDGTIHLAVSGFPDFEFIGLKDSTAGIHQESGNFDVRVTLGVAQAGDVDYYSFTDLVPGSAFAVEVTQASFDTTLAWLDEQGDVIYVDDDGGQDLWSRVRGYVPLSGTVNIAITAFGDVEFSGQHIESGDYTLALTQLEQ